MIQTVWFHINGPEQTAGIIMRDIVEEFRALQLKWEIFPIIIALLNPLLAWEIELRRRYRGTSLHTSQPLKLTESSVELQEGVSPHRLHCPVQAKIINLHTRLENISSTVGVAMFKHDAFLYFDSGKNGIYSYDTFYDPCKEWKYLISNLIIFFKESA